VVANRHVNQVMASMAQAQVHATGGIDALLHVQSSPFEPWLGASSAERTDPAERAQETQE
jgi:hypothetical protein